MRGILFAMIGGASITLQGVANSQISKGIGTWQTATITHLTGFLMALLILLVIQDPQWRMLKQVKSRYMTGGSLGAIIIFCSVTAIQQIGVTLAISILLIAQLGFTFITDRFGWFEMQKQKMGVPQFIGMGMMMAGVFILQFS